MAGCNRTHAFSEKPDISRSGLRLTAPFEIMVHVALTSLLVGLMAVFAFPSPVLADKHDGTFRFYEHKGTLVDQMRMRAPELGAAHAISLSSDLHTEIDEAERDQIRRLGPWLSEDGISHNAQVLIRTIQDARIHGLSPETYELARILRAVDVLSHLDDYPLSATSEQDEDNQETGRALRRQLNNLLDTNFIKLVRHLGHGVVDGRKLQNRLYRTAPRVNAFNLLVAISSAEITVRDALSSVSPSHPDYLRLTRLMRDLLTERSTGISRTEVASNNNAQLASEADDKQSLRERLLETSDLSFEAYMAANPDAELLKALRAFQARHGLEQGSFANDRTRAALNSSVDDDIKAVALSLERWRWLPRELGERHLFVNIPDYHVNLIDKGQITLSMTAVVGKDEHQTPSFTRDMSYMEFNPTWTVPASIANKELIPKERMSPGYLVSRDFDFLKRVDNRLIKIPANSVTREDFNAASFPYILQQRGGPINALGRMKFMMPNQYAIYLHDTQAKKHFTLNDRAYSHGCVRLSDPDALALALLSGDGYSEQQIKKSLQSNETHRLRFRKPVPTHLVYLTAWVDKDNRLQTRPDIYRNDARLEMALRESGTLLSESDNNLASYRDSGT